MKIKDLFKLVVGIGFIFSTLAISESTMAQGLTGDLVPSPPPIPNGCTCSVGSSYTSSSGKCRMTCIACGTCNFDWANPYVPENPKFNNGCTDIQCDEDPPTPPPTPPACVAGTVDAAPREQDGDCVQAFCECDPADANNCGFVLYSVDPAGCGGGWGPSPSPSPQP